MKKIYLTEEGYQQYLKEIEDIREKIRKNNLDITEFTSDDAYGDGWHDNFAYEQAIAKENALFHNLEKKLRDLSSIEIIQHEKQKHKGIKIGDTVLLLFDGDATLETYYISGQTSSNLNRDIPEITVNSPLGQAIFMKEVNSRFTFSIHGEVISGKIVEIK